MRFLLCAVVLSIAVETVFTQIPTTGVRLWLRADSLVSFTTPAGASEQLATWGSRVNGLRATAATGAVLTSKPINGKPGFLFNGSSFLEGPSVFPVRRDYTMYIVLEWSGVHSANNIVSGQSRALYTASPGQPTMLHSADFGRLLMAESALSGPTVLRVTYSESTRMATISFNGREVASGEIPVNIDSVIYIGAYQRGYCYTGTLSEILLYDRIPSLQERQVIEAYLHQRYAIPQYKEPAPKSVSVLQAPKNMAVVTPNSRYDIVYRVNTNNVRSVKFTSVTSGTPTVRTIFDVKAGTVDTIPWMSTSAGFDESSIVIVADTGSPIHDTLYVAQNIVSGEAFTVTGQSNSIFGDATIIPSAWARTFGKNFSSSASDTVFYASKADGNGGGPHVGAWGLHLQNAIADQFRTPSLCINGGVGGTRIEQHLPDANNRYNRSTIYGSWLYRVVKSGMQNNIRWLFWYQGESNHSTENYVELFGQLYKAWKQDLPNLQYVVVVQIRPGCAGPNHAKLRDEQRRLESLYPNVIVHAASGLPAHDGCHYGGQGYGVLGAQLFDIYRINELGMQPGIYRTAPAVRQAVALGQNVYRVDFDRSIGLRMTSDVVVGGVVRRPTDAWFADNDGKLHPTYVQVEGNSVTMGFAKAVSTISYVPDYAYDDGTTVFQGPWLVNADGVGALTFHNVGVTTTNVYDSIDHLQDSLRSVFIQQSSIASHQWLQNAQAIYDINGQSYATDSSTLVALAPGMYTAIVNSYPRCFVVVP